MPGWIIQGVRGEGKSLCAVGKIKEYMLRGRPVATNLNLFLEKLVPPENSVIAYRLPDHPRLEDFQILPPAYDRKYKGEDKNGLLVLDELGTWLNARNWNDKSRLQMLNWLFLSRKDHWDIILLAQDYEMIDAQVRTTLCDYLVQASRLDRQKVPYLSGALKFFGLSGMLPRVHRYHVFYGMTTATKPQETWSYTGKDFYDAYDTNQKFLNGHEPLGGTLVDMRATYSYIPANYLTRHVFVERLEQKITDLKSLPGVKTGQEMDEVKSMAIKKGASAGGDYLKIGFLVVGLVGFLGWKFLSGGFHQPALTSVVPPVVAAPVSAPAPASASVVSSAPVVDVPAVDSSVVEVASFVDELLKNYRPRLSIVAYEPSIGFVGNVDFYKDGQIVESYKISVLHHFGVMFLHTPYGADMVYKGKTYLLTAWIVPKAEVPEPIALETPVEHLASN